MWPSGKILCPTDFSEGAEAAIVQAEQIAHQSGAALCLLHVVPVLATLPADPRGSTNMMAAGEVLQAQAKKALEDLADRLRSSGLQVTARIVIGDAASQIVEAAEREKADLIVISTYGKTGWRRLAFGSVTEKVVRTASCPVLTLRSEPKQ